jgi:radical SAM protein with 4Fe4S-binding SPASM domain
MKKRHGLLSKLVRASRDYLGHRLICSQLPFRIWLEPTNICNIKCEMCPNPLIPRDQKGKMQFSLYKKIIDEVGSFVDELYIFHRGESLIHPQLPEMIKYAKERGVLVKLNTNATLLTEKKSRDILDSGLDLISFSVDGYEKDVFERIRAGAHFDRVVENVKTFLQLKKREGFKHPLTQIEIMEFLAYSDTDIEEKRSAFFRRFEGLSFDRTVLRRPHNVGGNVELGETQGYDIKKNHYSPCSFPWYSLAIHWNGNVCPCPRDFMGDLVVGNVGTMSIVDIWNCEKMLSVRRHVLNRDFESQACCRNCDQVYKYQVKIGGVPIGYLSALIKDSPLVYALRRFFVRKEILHTET